MLQPTNRLTLIDAMRPPAGFGLDAAMGVTFTLDLRALLAAPAAFALTAADAMTGDATTHEPIELLHAVRTHARKLTILSQVGEIALPPSRRVFAFLERSVIPVRAPRGGVVHPKAWVLRYAAPDDPGERCLRVLVASRNLTFDASWDTILRLDESPAGAGADLSALGEMFEGLLSASTMPILDEHTDRVASLSASLRAATFALPAGVDELRFAVLGMTQTPSPLPKAADRSLILSPFVGDDFFTDVRPAPVDELVSRPESLDLLDTTLEPIGAVYAFDDGSAVDHGSAEERLSPRDPGRPLIGLHAKVFAFEQGRRARLFLGSANATGAAFTRNVEILVELEGAIERLGIDRLCDDTPDERGLRSLFVPYTRDGAAPDEDASEEFGPLDAGRHALARLTFTGDVEETTTGWAVTYRSSEPVPDIGGAEIHCWPLGTPGHRRLVAGGAPLELRFATTVEAISGFLAFEISGDEGALTGFVVPVPLRGVPERRDRLLLRALVGNAERFLRYLLALLDEDAALLDVPDTAPGRAPEATGDGVGRGLPVLEKLLRTMRKDPAKLAALHPLVSDLGADDALPAGFAELWATLYDVGVAGGDR